MALTRAQKEAQVTEIRENIQKAHTVVVWEYLGLKAEEIAILRNKISKAGAKNTVYKNRVAKVAFKEEGKEEIMDQLQGSSSFLFTFDDNMDSISELNKFVKERDEINFKGAYIEGVWHDAEQITAIAGLPPKTDLLSMLLSVLQGSMRNLAYSLKQVAEKMPADGSPAPEEVKEEPAKQEAPAEEAKEEVKEEAVEEKSVEETPSAEEPTKSEEEAPPSEPEIKEEPAVEESAEEPAKETEAEEEKEEAPAEEKAE